MFNVKRRRILKKIALICHDLSPTQGSEAGNAWQIITNLSENNEYHIYYSKCNQLGSVSYFEQISKAKGIGGNVTLIPVEYPSVTKPIVKLSLFLSRGGSPIGISALYWINYEFWLSKVYSVIKGNGYDVVHLVNHISLRHPGRFYKLKSKFIWGPTSGLSMVKARFFDNKWDAFWVTLRNAILNLIKLNPGGIKRAATSAHKIFAVTDADVAFFKKYNNNVVQLLDVVAINKGINNRVRTADELNILWVGRVDKYKKLNIALEAIRGLKGVRLTVVGDGPLVGSMKSFCALNEIGNVTWTGALPKVSVKKLMQQSDLLVHTSIKEAGSTVVMEAIDASLPVIAHNYFGMAFALAQGGGYLVDYVSEDVSIKTIKRHLEEIIENPTILEQFKSQLISVRSRHSLESMINLFEESYSEHS